MLTLWRRELRSGHLTAEGRPQFIALQIAADSNAPTAKQPTAVPAAGGDDLVEITLANGRKIALGIAVDPMALARLVQVLDRA